MQRQSSPNNVKPVSRTLATFPSSIRQEGTKDCRSIASWAIRYIESRIRKENLRNVKPILGRPDNPLLPGTVDAVLLLKTYHEVAQPIVLLRNLRASLSPGAKVGVIDRNGNGENHGVARDIVI